MARKRILEHRILILTSIKPGRSFIFFWPEILTKASPPERNVIFGKSILSDEVDIGYGPARFLNVIEVKEVHRFLQGLSADELWGRFDLDAIRKANVYPENWTGDEEDREYLTDYYLNLVDFYARASENNLCLIQYISWARKEILEN